MKAPALMVGIALAAVAYLTLKQSAGGLAPDGSGTVVYKGRSITIAPAAAALGGWQATFASPNPVGVAVAYGATAAEAQGNAQILIDSGQ